MSLSDFISHILSVTFNTHASRILQYLVILDCSPFLYIFILPCPLLFFNSSHFPYLLQLFINFLNFFFLLFCCILNVLYPFKFFRFHLLLKHFFSPILTKRSFGREKLNQPICSFLNPYKYLKLKKKILLTSCLQVFMLFLKVDGHINKVVTQVSTLIT